ncbi:cobamide remodeling phosphodiesterase CbiR [Desulfonatronum thioautotrophicum]|uniref:cobamide remodeling phosphodiesterase CbiR n=1 Tax=Desulfonatronum thioautotrophicum TaxID=617001 RepID=UPI00069C777C|nr:cobamide remodeling phosphodiesterase CbiR [Desulfonatronum thioautotrophicum]
MLKVASISSPRPHLRHARIAAPSFVWPKHIAENCNKLRKLVDEVGLLFFQAEACLDYTEQDLPTWLAGTGLRFHVHLPLDLPWNTGVQRVWNTVSALQRKTCFLQPLAYVLHPPPLAPLRGDSEAAAEVTEANGAVCSLAEKGVVLRQDVELLADFIRCWEAAGLAPRSLLLENTRENDLSGLWPLIQATNLGICLDLGHLLVAGQQTHRLPGVWPRVRMVHLSAPGQSGADGQPRDGHRSLAELDQRGWALFEEILDQVHPDCVLMIEVFYPEGLMESLHILRIMTGRR